MGWRPDKEIPSLDCSGLLDIDCISMMTTTNMRMMMMMMMMFHLTIWRVWWGWRGQWGVLSKWASCKIKSLLWFCVLLSYEVNGYKYCFICVSAVEYVPPTKLTLQHSSFDYMALFFVRPREERSREINQVKLMKVSDNQIYNQTTCDESLTVLR